MRTVISGAQGGLLRAIRRFFEAGDGGAFPAMVVEGVASEAWASATFSGQRHRLELRFDHGDLALIDRLIAALGNAELVVPGHIVADIALVEHEMRDEGLSPRHRLVFEALTVAD